MSTRMKIVFAIAAFIVTFALSLPHSIRYWEAHLPNSSTPTVEYAVDF